MNIALLGGRFDPPHFGHLNIARYVLQAQTGIDEVWLLPANTHPWKSIIASPRDRLAMTRMLEEERLKVSSIDIKRGGETYTIDTIQDLLKRTNNTYYWVCGSDQIYNLNKWKNFHQLQEFLQFLIIPRKGNTKVHLPENFKLISGEYIPTDLSSSKVRDRIKKGLSISNLVPKKVEIYIKENRLYK